MAVTSDFLMPMLPFKALTEPMNEIQREIADSGPIAGVSPKNHDRLNMIPNGTIADLQEMDMAEIHIPDMFASFMSIEPNTSSHYLNVKAEADAWIARHSLGMIVEFDDGHLQKDLHAAAEEIVQIIALLDDSHPLITPEKYPLRYAAQVNWQNFKKKASPALQLRYKRHMKEWMLGILGQVASQGINPRNVAVKEYLGFRRRTIGVMPCTCLVESALGIELPEEVLEHPSIATCQQISADLTLLENDILSYNKDVINGQEMNILKILEFKGLSLQEAVDEVTNMINDCYPRWYRALADLPRWGSDIDRDVLLYVDGLRDITLGSLIWSFERGRYFSKEEGAHLRRTRVMRMIRSVPC
ncbi:isoprenoid synthase domain-containing protein [Truncatella angustata]|uniref:Terpene synthase n=1 Tax=Truncatella angustata TaxID=152316 RepID=A0A9P8UIX2_9PEZI|nr:isoprenoid synthase domain-containing protein [Truncatella angustata]KAH6652987.1 isoprenoid synthase domain-containing protein [Truncatella angustata]